MQKESGDLRVRNALELKVIHEIVLALGQNERLLDRNIQYAGEGVQGGVHKLDRVKVDFGGLAVQNPEDRHSLQEMDFLGDLLDLDFVEETGFPVEVEVVVLEAPEVDVGARAVGHEEVQLLVYFYLQTGARAFVERLRQEGLVLIGAAFGGLYFALTAHVVVTLHFHVFVQRNLEVGFFGHIFPGLVALP